MKAPSFSLPDQTGQVHDLSQYKGRWVLLYWYPKDDTPGCTREACSIRDHWADFKKLNAQVFGVSVDSVDSHQRFAQKYELPFTLLSDENKETAQAYKVWGEKTFMGKKYMGVSRMSFLIDPNGEIAKVYEKVKPDTHAQEVLDDLKEFLKKETQV
jgi:thioredoxin-dependent peroxiredoxin